MCNPAGHLSQGAEALLLHNHLLGPAQLFISSLKSLGDAHLIIKAAALFLGGDDFDLQGLLLRTNRRDFGNRLLIFVPDLLQDEHNHADGNEELQHRSHKKTSAEQVFVLL